MKKMDKMRRINSKFRKFFEEDGWLVYINHHTRWNKDIFGLFDGFMVKENKSKLIKHPVVFFQLKANKFPVFKDYKEFSGKYGVLILLAKWVDRKGFDFRIIKDGEVCS